MKLKCKTMNFATYFKSSCLDKESPSRGNFCSAFMIGRQGEARAWAFKRITCCVVDYSLPLCFTSLSDFGYFL